MNKLNLEEMSTLESLYQQLSTDSDLEGLVTGPLYEVLRARLGLLLSNHESGVMTPDKVQRDQLILDHRAHRPFNPFEKAPLCQKVRDLLKRDARDITATAARHGDEKPDANTVMMEQSAADEHFELGCWLFFYHDKLHVSTLNRIDCLRRIIASGIGEPKNRFHTVFRFGERQFDSLFEMDDGKQVIHALRRLAQAHPDEEFGLFFKANGWPIHLEEATAA